MTETAFLNELARGLGGLDAPAREEILRDYREHFASAREAGRSDEETSRKLGDPRSIARSYDASVKLARAEKASSIAGRSWHLLGLAKALVILAPLNFIMVLGPFLVLAVALVVGWSISGGLLAGSGALLGRWATMQPVEGLATSVNVSVLLLFVSGICFSLLGLLGMGLLSVASLRGLLRYFKWNLNFVNKEGRIVHD
jgi:uncharacterized membrane protein